MPIQKVEITVTTQSQPMQWGNLPKPNPPKITMNGAEVAVQQAYSSVGWKLLIIDPTKDITNPDSYLYNGYIGLSSDGHNWMSPYYDRMYLQMLRSVLLSGNIESQLAIVASYGLDNNMPPITSFLPTLFDFGAGPRLQYWETHCNPGSEVGNPEAYISFPANYILIGYTSWSYGQGYEQYDTAQGSMPVTSTLSATVQNIVPG